MKLETAMERLQARADGELSLDDPSNVDDIKLGREAIKEIIAARTYSVGLIPEKLPGETEE